MDINEFGLETSKKVVEVIESMLILKLAKKNLSQVEIIQILLKTKKLFKEKIESEEKIAGVSLSDVYPDFDLNKIIENACDDYIKSWRLYESKRTKR